MTSGDAATLHVDTCALQNLRGKPLQGLVNDLVGDTVTPENVQLPILRRGHFLQHVSAEKKTIEHYAAREPPAVRQRTQECQSSPLSEASDKDLLRLHSTIGQVLDESVDRRGTLFGVLHAAAEGWRIVRGGQRQQLHVKPTGNA